MSDRDYFYSEQRLADVYEFFEQRLAAAITAGDFYISSGAWSTPLWDALHVVATEHPNPKAESISAARDAFYEHVCQRYEHLL